MEKNCLVCSRIIKNIRPCLSERKKFCSFECRYKFQEGKRLSPQTEFKKGIIPHNKGKENPAMRGSFNPKWMGDNVGYLGVHEYLKRHFPHKGVCEECGKNAKRIELANITGKYIRNISHYRYLCVSCHRRLDKTYLNLHPHLRPTRVLLCQKPKQLGS